MTDIIQPNPSAQVTEPNQMKESPLSMTEIMYMMACYYYIHASDIGYEALKALDPSFVVVNSFANTDIFKKSEELKTTIDGVEKKLDATAATVDAEFADKMTVPPNPLAPEASSAGSTVP